jgi:seryl-tRNA synthetase
MLDRRFIRENPDIVRLAVEQKGCKLDVDRLLERDADVRHEQFQVDELQRERNEVTAAFKNATPEERVALKAKNAALEEELRVHKAALEEASAELTSLLLMTPGIPWKGAPVGTDESANQVIRTWGKAPEFSFEPLDHVAYTEKRRWVEFARGRKISGERGYAMTGELVRLEMAVHAFAIDMLVEQGFRMVAAPALVREESLVGSGFFPLHKDEVYALPADDLYLAGTAEVALVGLHADEVISHADLPLLYAGVSPCFRREVGSAGRDVRGLLRVHQFNKVEQFVICAADEAESAHWHQTLLDTAERVLQAFELHYHVVECATGDMGLGKYRMNDINTWFPSLNAFRETHSCSSLHDWQARRAAIRYKDQAGKIHFAHTLNNTAVATPRLLAALIENRQTADGLLDVPPPLRSYLGGREAL